MNDAPHVTVGAEHVRPAKTRELLGAQTEADRQRQRRLSAGGVPPTSLCDTEDVLHLRAR